MTYKELNELYYIRREIARDEQKIEELRRKATSSTTALSAETAGPHAGVSDEVGAYAAAIADLTSDLAVKTEERVAVYHRTLAYIEGIEDSHTRLMLKLRFVDNLRWDDVAAVIGGYWTGQSVRQAFSRWARENLERED